MRALNQLVGYLLILIFAGCAHNARHFKLADADRVEILSTVLREMGTTSSRDFFWLNLPGSDFEAVAARFAASPPKYRYARWDNSASLGNTQLLTVRIEEASGAAACVSATYSGEGYFSEYTYKLVRREGRWYIVGREPTVAS